MSQKLLLVVINRPTSGRHCLMMILLHYVSAKELVACCGEHAVKIFSNGSCVWLREFQLSVTHCPIDITWFPFDQQQCDIIYESNTLESKEFKLNSEKHPVDREHYTSNSEWELLGKTTQLY